MKRRVAFYLALVLVGAALLWTEITGVEVPVGPAALLYLIADTERELSRLPVALTRLSDEEEIHIGDALAEGYASALGANSLDAEGRAVAAYLDRVGSQLDARARRKLPYRFHYVPARDFINAFALPGGHVFIGRGLIELMDTEDELAAVLGHEIEHIDQYHCAERIQLQARLRKLRLGVLSDLAAIPFQVFQAGYSKNQELEADREGTILAVRSSYSPRGAVRMFEKFDRLRSEQLRLRQPKSPQQELSRVARETLEGYFRTHPPPAERVARIRKLIREEHWENLTRQRPLAIDQTADTSQKP